MFKGPLGESFYAGMNQLQNSIHRMVTNMELMRYNMAANTREMQERMARQRQYILNYGIRNLYFQRGYGPGFNSFTTSTGGTGYVYK